MPVSVSVCACARVLMSLCVLFMQVCVSRIRGGSESEAVSPEGELSV